MRLPLGILSGGFIGAGAIVRYGSLVRGLTTVATLWFVTVLGLCFGGGQLALGLAVLTFGVLVLEGLRLHPHSLFRQLRHPECETLRFFAGLGVGRLRPQRFSMYIGECFHTSSSFGPIPLSRTRLAN
jgi:hypothetical protein